MSWEKRNEATNKVGPRKHLLINIGRAHKTKKKGKRTAMCHRSSCWIGLDGESKTKKNEVGKKKKS
jgi:hypothetical protein